MINFRYHVVSITSIFLALAIGLVLGTAALNGPLADNLKSQVSSLAKSNGQLRDQVGELQTRADSQDDFVRQAAPMLLSRRLSGSSVVVTSTPSADSDDRDGVVEMLRQAGATVVGTVRLTDQYTDPRRDDVLQDLATKLVPASVTGLPNNGVGVETASALLATVLVDGTAQVSPANRSSILTGYSSLGVLTVESAISGPADAMVVVAGQAATDDDADARNAALLTTLRAFDRVVRHLVVAAPAAGGAGSPVAEIRDAGAMAKTVCTVDGVSLAEGQAVVALALADAIRGRVGHYGTGDGATARLPDLRS